ncbi:class I SAM-dependent DNA methyltransferase [Halanaerobium praevalens]|uniref:Methyltransferase type 11 n=1 Tax=Halanaerobium praevalens (strain ATCC 33744 / DSM 2228 / GSL) TaxID=572479 RepID=E3DQ27_HALPG|nr:class I SAM-dependent methyltransferase [Halanaerobium praevalens]ADO76778.1 Methyltransferase type 11 [Halanaerobium praevalens DSM 2228]
MEQSYTTYFAEIYDQIMESVPYDYWYRYLQDLLIYYQQEPKKILELAAGTSNMTLRLIELESLNQITALDLSSAMITKAQEKLEYKLQESNSFKKYSVKDRFKYLIEQDKRKFSLQFEVQDMKDFYFKNQFDLIVSFFDSLNYLTEKAELEACFKNAANSLTENGLFIFDLNSIGRIKTIAEKSVVFEDPSYECFWQDIVNKDKNLWKVKLKICPNNKALPCFEEVHTERGYKISTVLDLLANSGFQAVDVYNAFSFAQGKNNSDRLYFVAAKAQSRLEKNQGLLKKIYFNAKNRVDYFLVNLKYLF